MTAIFYPDLTATSDGGGFTVEARSPHNGAIHHRNGRAASEDEFGFKYRQHQSEFRYRLLDHTLQGALCRLFRGAGPRVVWERWQADREDSPGELVVSIDGWTVIRTHGFDPELIAVRPDGQDAIRVLITGPGSEHRDPDPAHKPPQYHWSLDHLAFSTAGLYWTAHSWRAFFDFHGGPHFFWRTSWGQRLVLDLSRAVAYTDGEQLPDGLAAAVADAERQGVVGLLDGLSRRMGEVRELLGRKGDEDQEPDPLLFRVQQASAALHLAGVSRLRECVPFLREWESIDSPSTSTGSSAMTGRWWLQTQHFRPIVHHALKLLGEEPRGFPTYHFCTYSDDWTPPMPEHVPDRRERAAGVDRGMSAEEVLGRLGSPDFVRRRSRQVATLYEWTEDWEYDHRDGTTWTTLRLTWEEHRKQGRLTAAEEVAPYWLGNNDREAEYLRPL